MLNIFIYPFKLSFEDKSISIDVLFFSFLLILIPIALITGPAVPDILLSLIAIYFLIKSFLKKLFLYYQNYIVIFFLLFCLYGFLRSLFSEIPFESLTNEGSVFYFRYIFFSMGVWYLLDNNPYLSKCLLIISVISITIVCLDGLLQYFRGVNIIGFEKHSLGRLTGLFGDEPIIGRYISYLSIFTFALMYNNFPKTKKMIIASIAFLIMSEVTVFLSGERAPFFNISLFTILILIYIPNFRLYRLMGILISVIIIFGILFINPSVKKRMVDNTFEQVSETKIPFLPYSKEHEKIYITAIDLFIEQPIFGAGTNTYRFLCNRNKNDLFQNCYSHPHNYYIQILAELGFTGFLFLSTFFFYLFCIGLRQLFFIIKKNQKKQIPFNSLLYTMVLFVYFWPLIPTMSFYNNWMNVLIMLPLGFFMKYSYNKKNVN